MNESVSAHAWPSANHVAAGRGYIYIYLQFSWIFIIAFLIAGVFCHICVLSCGFNEIAAKTLFSPAIFMGFGPRVKRNAIEFGAQRAAAVFALHVNLSY